MSAERTPVARGIDVAIRVAILALLLAGCFLVLAPFTVILGWSLVMSVALYPTFGRVAGWLDGREKLAAVAITSALLALFVAPAVVLSETLVGGVSMVRQAAEAGTLRIPMPPESIATWPLIGTPLSEAWTAAATNLDSVLSEHKDTAVAVARWLVAQVAAMGLGFLQVVAAVVVTGFLLVFSEPLAALGDRVAGRLAGRNGHRLRALAIATTRSVARGVLGVALVQAVLAGLGLLAAGVPGAGLWSMLTLFTCTVQLGAGPILIPAAIYLFVAKGTLTGVLFSIWCAFVFVIDNFLKPIWLGRGVDVPMIVVVLGAIGGLLAMGVIGLFAGAIILVLGYSTVKVWLEAEA